jgi:hypothetical protein
MQHLIGKNVQFTSKIEEMEAYPENSMRARIVSIVEKDTDNADVHEHMYKITFDYSDFDEFNAALEAPNYYNKDGVACLTAREANMYKKQELIYFGSPTLWPFENYFTVLGEKSNALIARFKESGATNYVEWLESQIEV